MGMMLVRLAVGATLVGLAVNLVVVLPVGETLVALAVQLSVRAISVEMVVVDTLVRLGVGLVVGATLVGLASLLLVVVFCGFRHLVAWWDPLSVLIVPRQIGYQVRVAFQFQQL